MNLQERISAFAQLGQRLHNLTDEELETLCRRVENSNSWFSPAQTKSALEGLELFLNRESIEEWVGKYPVGTVKEPKSVGVLMAGNVPAVGFHDFMSVLMSGHQVHAKLSTGDGVLMQWLAGELIKIAPGFSGFISFEPMLKGKDAYIATGSDNSARYFEYYFGKYPNIIRKNRTSVAVLTGNETAEDYRALGKDVFQYFGLGCRNISKVFIKEESQLNSFLDAIENFSDVINHHKYRNNYDYNKSIYLVNQQPHLDNGFLLLTQGEGLVSPISVLYYGLYENDEDLKKQLAGQKDKIQCVVSKDGQWEESLPLGEAQCPGLEDYADNVDTMEFLTNLR
jgi:hypothetical protein